MADLATGGCHREKRTVEVKRDILWRVYVCFLGITVLSLLVLGRAFYIQRFQGHYWRGMSDRLQRRFVTLTADRGTIFSEDGQLLSTSVPTFDIYIDFNADGLREKKGQRFHQHVDSFALMLSHYFGDRTPGQYRADLVQAYQQQSRYYPLRKKLSFEDYKAFREFPLVRLGRNKSGVIVEVNSKRYMPFGLLANRTIGLSREHIASNGQVKKQNVGLERSYDSLLSGRDGQRLVRFIAGGAAIPVEGTQTDPENGKDIYTTLDVTIQDIAENALLRMLQQCEAPYGTAIVMETATGKIKAMANLGRRSDGSYWEDDNYALRVTEPGSTIKLVTLMAVLEKGSSRIDDLVEIGEGARAIVGSKSVTDAERAPRPVLTLRECFAHSSNIGMSRVAYKAFHKKPSEIQEFFHRFRFDQASPIDLSNVPQPGMAPLNQKGSAEGNMLWMSFGYNVQVSPLQVLTLYNAVANNGRMMKPYLVSQVKRNGTVLKQFDPVVLDGQLCRPDVIQAARSAMEATVTDGTATTAFKGLPFSVAGKTGTAHVSDGPIKYKDGVYQASFVGYFPADRPQYSCIVVIRTRPRVRSHFGGGLAAPVFREIATKLHTLFVNRKAATPLKAERDSLAFFYAGRTADIRTVMNGLGVGYRDSTLQQEWSALVSANGTPVAKGIPQGIGVMPNVRGLGLKDALALLEDRGMKVSIRGRGKVVSQSLAPGTRLSPGLTVILELS